MFLVQVGIFVIQIVIMRKPILLAIPLIPNILGGSSPKQQEIGTLSETNIPSYGKTLRVSTGEDLKTESSVVQRA